MAKNKIEIDIVVNGKMQKATVSAQKLNKALGKTATGAQVADRTLKGAAGASSNTTKNFSKMAQGINGGLVPAYATLAANLFAVSAAFTFLKDAGNLVTLQKGQEAYAGATGVALRSLSNDIIAATDAQINFTDASQAAAIGVSAGLTGDQLTRLGTAAKDASIILGRDVTDSFNRLIRGVTKAEPELLDELGIILRLDDATQKYADSLNRDAKSLTAFERSQAVANDVLEQAEKKYSRIIAVVNPGVNVFNKLGKSFDDIINSIKEFAAAMLGPFAEAISQFPALGVALLGVFGKGVLTAALPGLRDIGENAKASAEQAQESFDKAKASLKDYTTETRIANKQSAAERAQALGDPGFKTRNPNSGFEMIKQGKGGDLSSQQIVGMQRAVQNNKKMTNQMKAQWKAALAEMLLATKTSTKGIEQEFKKTTGKIGLFMRMAQVQVTGAFATMKLAAASFAGYAATALSVISWIALIATLGAVVYQFFKTKKAADESSEALDYASRKVEELTDEFKNFNKIQEIITEDGAGSLKYFTALGERIGSLSTASMNPLLETGFSTYIDFQTENLKNVEKLEARIEKAQSNVNTALAKSERAGGSYAPFEVAYEDAVDKLNYFNEKLNESNKTFGDFLNTSDDQRLAKLGTYFTDQAENLSLISNNLGGAGSSSIKKYLGIVQELLNTRSPERARELWVELEGQQKAVADATSLFKNYTRGLEDTQNQAKQLRTSFMGMTPAESAVKALEAQLELTNSLRDEYGNLLPSQQKNLDITEKDLAFAKALDNLEKNKITRANELALRTEKDLRGRTKRQKDLINLGLQAKQLDDNRKYIEEQLALLEDQRLEPGETLNNQQQTRLTQLQQELALNEEKERSLERQISLGSQLLDTANQALESNLQSNIAAIIKGEEKSLKDAILLIGQGVLNSLADTLSGQLTDIIMGTDPITTGLKQGKAIASEMIAAGHQVATTIASAIKTGPSKAGEVLLGETKGSKAMTEDISSGEQGVTREGTIRRGGIFSNFINGLKSIFDPDSSFLDKFKNIFSGGADAFKNIFGGIGSLLTSIIPGMGGGFMSLFARNGGVFSQGRNMPGYAAGGVSKGPNAGYPVMMHGTEAVVPLPDGKSIPVSMQGAGQQNNVTVNVSVDNQGNASTNTQQDSAQAGNLGSVIARAVQQELQNQKRSGGILNPYGAA